MVSVFSQSNDDISPPASELMPVATCANGTDLEEALREISREISSEFSCARDADYATSLGKLFTTKTWIWLLEIVCQSGQRLGLSPLQV